MAKNTTPQTEIDPFIAAQIEADYRAEMDRDYWS